MGTWTKTSKDRYEAVLNGRRFVLICNRKTRSHTVHNPQFICIGRKPRVSTTCTWYNVIEKVGDEVVDHTGLTTASNLKEAKVLAEKLASGN